VIKKTRQPIHIDNIARY